MSVESGSPLNGYLPPAAYGESDATDSRLYSPVVSPASYTPDTDADIRCGKCGKLLAEFATRPYQIRCARCKTVKGAQPRLAA